MTYKQGTIVMDIRGEKFVVTEAGPKRVSYRRLAWYAPTKHASPKEFALTAYRYDEGIASKLRDFTARMRAIQSEHRAAAFKESYPLEIERSEILNTAESVTDLSAFPVWD